eukprot:1385188-Prymnesium_polylepis.1
MRCLSLSGSMPSARRRARNSGRDIASSLHASISGRSAGRLSTTFVPRSSSGSCASLESACQSGIVILHTRRIHHVAYLGFLP